MWRRFFVHDVQKVTPLLNPDDFSLSSPPPSTPLRFGHVLTSVERAIAEMRAARPVVIRHHDQAYAVISAECFDPGHISLFTSESFTAGAVETSGAHLTLTAARLTRLGLERTQAGCISIPVFDEHRIAQLALTVGAKIDAPVHSPHVIDEAALALAHLSQLIPAVICVPVSGAASHMMLQVNADDIESFIRETTRHVTLISRAPVPLEGGVQTEFVVFRGGEGLRDQVAIIVGSPHLQEGVHVRMHSACLTGDLFGSLKCDCGDQLRGTVRFMADNGGGILLYLDQEGRGNGIANKMRAYALQAQGWDTYDADEVFGLGMDQRRFGFAAQMLKVLGVSKVRLMTNNPIKIAALKDAGLELLDNQRVLGRLTVENVQYLSSKRERAGHLIHTSYLNSAPSLSSSGNPPPLSTAAGVQTGPALGVSARLSVCSSQPE
jgi:GTP cyclohydrolase II